MRDQLSTKDHIPPLSRVGGRREQRATHEQVNFSSLLLRSREASPKEPPAQRRAKKESLLTADPGRGSARAPPVAGAAAFARPRDRDHATAVSPMTVFCGFSRENGARWTHRRIVDADVGSPNDGLPRRARLGVRCLSFSTLSRLCSRIRLLILPAVLGGHQGLAEGMYFASINKEVGVRRAGHACP